MAQGRFFGQRGAVLARWGRVNICPIHWEDERTVLGMDAIWRATTLYNTSVRTRALLSLVYIWRVSKKHLHFSPNSVRCAGKTGRHPEGRDVGTLDRQKHFRRCMIPHQNGGRRDEYEWSGQCHQIRLAYHWWWIWGLFAALKAKQNGIKDVVIVDKGAVALSCPH